MGAAPTARRPRNMMNPDEDLALLDRYLSGECSPAEREEVERQLRDEPARQELVGWMRNVKGATKRIPSGWDGGALWDEVRQQMTVDAEAAVGNVVRSVTPRPVPRVRPRLAWVLKVAAVIALAAGGVAIWRVTPTHRDNTDVASARTFKTQFGERAVFRLIDGTMITLAAGSTLDVPARYDAGRRDVYLRGRAYFDVAHNARSPFRVHSGAIVTRVLGTRFDVRAYPEDSVISVVVAEGSVAVRDDVVLASGDAARLDIHGRLRVERGVDVARYLAWTDGGLEFDNTPFRDVVPELERWYDLEIRLAVPALGDRPLTASLRESAAEVMALLGRSLHLRYDWQGRVVTFYPE